MMLPWEQMVRKYNLIGAVTGVLHIGAHLAEEAASYDQLGDVPVWWIEANPDVFAQIGAALAPYPLQTLIPALITSEDGAPTAFHVTNNDGMSSSVFPFGTHAQSHPDTVWVADVVLRSRTIDSLVAEHGIEANMLVMYIQGAEGLALQGAEKFLASVDYVMTEVNTEQVYQGCAMLPEIDALLSGFERVETTMTPHGWGDAFFRRKDPVPLFLPAEQRVEIIRDYAQRFGTRMFIESGTSSGATTGALVDDFEQLVTIELDEGLAQNAVRKFDALAHVMCIWGDSGEVIAKLVPTLTKPAVFWLDGHFCGPGSAHGDLDTPIRAELAAALRAPKGSVILIDDARVFEGGAEHHLEPHYHDYPSLEWVREQAEAAGFSYEMRDDIQRLTPQ